MRSWACSGTWVKREAGTFKKLKISLSHFSFETSKWEQVSELEETYPTPPPPPPRRSPPLPLESTYESSLMPGRGLRAPVTTSPQMTRLESDQEEAHLSHYQQPHSTGEGRQDA